MKRSKKRQSNSIETYLRNISKKDSIILFVTIIIIVCIFFTKKVLLPQINEYNDKINELDFLREEQKKAEVAYEENITLESHLNELKNTYDDVSSKISKTPKLAQVIYDVENMIVNNKLNLVFIDVLDNKDTEEKDELEEIERGIKNKESINSSTEKEDTVTSLELDIQVVGNYTSIINFIKSLENYDRIAEIVNINISGDSKDLSSTIKVKFYNLNFKETENYEFNINKYGKVNSFE